MHATPRFAMRPALVATVIVALVLSVVAIIGSMSKPDTYLGYHRFNAQQHHCAVPKQTKGRKIWACVSDELADAGPNPKPGGKVYRFKNVAATVSTSPKAPPHTYSVPSNEPTDAGGDSNAPSLGNEPETESQSATPSNIGTNANTAIPSGSDDGDINPGQAGGCVPSPQRHCPVSGGDTGGTASTTQYHCQSEAGCWYRPRVNLSYFDSYTGYYGIYGPSGKFYQVGTDYYYIVWALAGTRNTSLHSDGYIQFQNSNGGYGNDVVGFSAAMQNGGVGHTSGGRQIGGGVCSGQVNNTLPNAQVGAPGHPFCEKTDTSSHSHNMTMEFEWVSSDPNVPGDDYWYCYTRSPIAYSIDGGKTKTFGFASLHAAPYHGLTTSDSNSRCTGNPGEITVP